MSGERGGVRAGRHAQSAGRPELIYRRTWRPTPPPPRQTSVVHHTIRQTVVHYHSVTRQHIHQRHSSIQFLRADAFLLILPRARQPGPGADMDPSRPTRSAQRLLHVFSTESAQRQLRPFYSGVIRSVLKEEQERYRSKPTQAVSLIWNLFGRRQAFRTLTRFYMGAVEKLGTNYYPALTGSNALYLAAGVVLHSRIYQRYVRQVWNHERGAVPLRYAVHERAVKDDLLRLPVARRALPPRETVEQIVDSGQERRTRTEPEPAAEVRLSGADFRALVQGVVSSLGRQTRLESLRRGGVS